MTYKQLIKHFKTAREARAAIGCSRQVLDNWRRRGSIPAKAQAEISEITAGKLAASK